MPTQRQIEANRRNAQKSTGPRTEQGKAKSRMNRLTHGFASPQSIIPGEDGHAFIALTEDLIDEYQPATPTEQILVEKMAQMQWQTQRALNLQGEAFLRLALDSQQGAIPKELGLLIRYYNAAGRAFHKAHAELVKAQKERKNSEIGFAPYEPVDEQPPAQENAPEFAATANEPAAPKPNQAAPAPKFARAA